MVMIFTGKLVNRVTISVLSSPVFSSTFSTSIVINLNFKYNSLEYFSFKIGSWNFFNLSPFRFILIGLSFEVLLLLSFL